MFRSNKQQRASPSLACWERNCQAFRTDSPCFHGPGGVSLWKLLTKEEITFLPVKLCVRGSSFHEPWGEKCHHMSILTPSFSEKLEESLSQLMNHNFPLTCDLEKNDIPETIQSQGIWGLVSPKIKILSIFIHPSIQSASQHPRTLKGQNKGKLINQNTLSFLQ